MPIDIKTGQPITPEQEQEKLEQIRKQVIKEVQDDVKKLQDEAKKIQESIQKLFRTSSPVPKK